MSGWNPKSSCSRFLAAGLVLLSFALSGCPASKRNSGKDIPPPPSPRGNVTGQVLRISQRNEPGDLDPAAATMPDEFFLIRALGEGLVSPNPNGGPPLPASAEAWEVSPDGKTYTFRLRNSTWSDGSQVTADDFVASYKRILTATTASPKASLFFMVTGARAYQQGLASDFASVGIRALDKKTLEVKLERANPGFLAYAASGPWIPVHTGSVDKYGRAWTKPGNHIGNGPYILEDWQPHRSILLRRRADYWDASKVLVERLHFLSYDSAEAEERAFRAGQLDITMALPPSKIAVYRERNPGVLRQAPIQETRYLSFNTQRPPLDDHKVRKALSLAIDRSELCSRILLAGQTPANRFLHPALSRLPVGIQQADNLEEARRLLAEAGFPGGKHFPVMELAGWANLPVMEAVQAMWRSRLGIETRISLRDAKVHVSTLVQGRYDVALIVAIPDVDDPLDILSGFNPGAPGNYPHWKDPDFSALVLRIEKSETPEERQRWIAEAEQRLLNEAPVAPLYYNTRTYLVRPRVHGWVEDGLWNRFYKNISLSPEYQPE